MDDELSHLAYGVGFLFLFVLNRRETSVANKSDDLSHRDYGDASVINCRMELTKDKGVDS